MFAGQRAEGFYVDLGSIFDLANLRPFQQLHAQYGMHVFSKPAPGVNATNELNVHSIALQVPIDSLTGSRTRRETDPRAVIGVWTTASRQHVRIWDAHRGKNTSTGPVPAVVPARQPAGQRGHQPARHQGPVELLPPSDDKRFASYVTSPELAALLPGLYPGVFPHLVALVKSGKPRADLEAILLTGIPAGLIKGFQNHTGPVLADMLRLNTAIKPARKPNILGVLGGDLAGFPNGRRVFDDVVTIELRAIAGLTYPLVDKRYKPDAAASVITDGLTPKDVKAPYLDHFPYLGVPYGGFYNPS